MKALCRNDCRCTLSHPTYHISYHNISLADPAHSKSREQWSYKSRAIVSTDEGCLSTVFFPSAETEIVVTVQYILSTSGCPCSRPAPPDSKHNFCEYASHATEKFVLIACCSNGNFGCDWNFYTSPVPRQIRSQFPRTLQMAWIVAVRTVFLRGWLRTLVSANLVIRAAEDRRTAIPSKLASYSAGYDVSPIVPARESRLSRQTPSSAYPMAWLARGVTPEGGAR